MTASEQRTHYYAPLSLGGVLLLLAPHCAFADLTRGTIILKRGADAGSITSTLLPDVYAQQPNSTEPCTSFDGILSFSHPMSLVPGDKFFSTGQLQQKSIEMMVDEINTKRCGAGVAGKRYGIELSTYGDDSSKDKVGAIVENAMVPINDESQSRVEASFWLGPYSSGLTGVMSPRANATNTVLVAGGAASTPVFRGNPTVFGTFPPTSKYLAQAIKALAEAGATSVSAVWEDASFTRGVCAALDVLAQEHGLEIRSQTEVPASPTAEHLDPVARNLSSTELNPDAVVTCVYAAGCAEWIASLRRAKWTPKAQVFTVCVGMDSFLDSVGESDAMYMTGISPWDPSLPGKDDVVGWSAAEFAEKFLVYAARTPTYHSASAAASVGALVQAIERADSFDTDEVARVLATEEFATLYGRVSFDDNGQSKMPSLFLQYDANVTVQTVYPLESQSGELVYPMPSWEHRDCSFLSTCETGSGSTLPGACMEDGSCECDGNSDAIISQGVGPDARCIVVPDEDITYISESLVVVGLVLFVLNSLLAMLCAAWTVHYRETMVVRNSQPIFLCLICFGAFVMNLAILPIGIQGKYRHVQDPMTGEMTDEPNPDIALADAACMAVPWLFSLGFSIVFSALFAKIWRIRMVLRAAERFQRKVVTPKDVAKIMVCSLAIQILIMLCWQLLDPMRWQREVVFMDENGYSTKSVGTCQSDNVLIFLAPLITIDGLMLMYALHLCFVTRNVSSDLQEGHWITGAVLSIIQILIISIPILIITENNNNAFYFVRAGVIFLMSSTVIALIFFPKMYRLHFMKQERRGAANSYSGVTNQTRRPVERSNIQIGSTSNAPLAIHRRWSSQENSATASIKEEVGNGNPSRRVTVSSVARTPSASSLNAGALDAARSGIKSACDDDVDTCVKDDDGDNNCPQGNNHADAANNDGTGAGTPSASSLNDGAIKAVRSGSCSSIDSPCDDDFEAYLKDDDGKDDILPINNDVVTDDGTGDGSPSVSSLDGDNIKAARSGSSIKSPKNDDINVTNTTDNGDNALELPTTNMIDRGNEQEEHIICATDAFIREAGTSKQVDVANNDDGGVEMAREGIPPEDNV